MYFSILLIDVILNEVEGSKNEATWCKMLWHYDAKYDSTPREFKGWWYGRRLTYSDGDPNFLSANRDGDGRRLNAYYDNPDNRWNRENGFAFVVSQLSSFLSSFLLNYWGVLFCSHDSLARL